MPHSERGVHVVIPARYASERLPGKPLADICGKPMIVRVHESVTAALPGADVVVAIDDDRVATALVEHGIASVMTSPDCASGTDRAAEVARSRCWDLSDAVINVQGDEPLIPADLLRAFVGFTASADAVPMSTVSVPVQDLEEVSNPNAVKVMTRADGTALTFSRAAIPYARSSVPSLSPYRRHVGLYGYRNDVLQQLTRTDPCGIEEIEKLEQLRALWIGIPIHVLGWHTTPPGGIDTPEDLERVRQQWQRSQS